MTISFNLHSCNNSIIRRINLSTVVTLSLSIASVASFDMQEESNILLDEYEIIVDPLFNLRVDFIDRSLVDDVIFTLTMLNGDDDIDSLGNIDAYKLLKDCIDLSSIAPSSIKADIVCETVLG